jgi:hypothetical protein
MVKKSIYKLLLLLAAITTITLFIGTERSGDLQVEAVKPVKLDTPRSAIQEIKDARNLNEKQRLEKAKQLKDISLSAADNTELIEPALYAECPTCTSTTSSQTATMQVTIFRNGNTQIGDDETLWIWPFISNDGDYYFDTEGVPDAHRESFSPTFWKEFMTDLDMNNITSFSFGAGETSKEITIDLDLLNSGDNHIALIIMNDDDSLMGIASVDNSGLSGVTLNADGGLDSGPYDMASNNIYVETIEKQNANDRFEILMDDVSTLRDITSGITEKDICNQSYCEYIADEDSATRELEMSLPPGYSFSQWNTIDYNRAMNLFDEADHTGTSNPFSFNTEDFQLVVATSKSLDVSPVYRFWSDRYRHHFYTDSTNEKNHVINNLSHDWTYEGTAYKAAPHNGSCPVATTELYRFWSDNYRGHFYTASNSEKDYVIANLSHDWEYEGVAYCVGSSYTSYTPLNVYRFWSDNYLGHFYTASSTERDHVIDNLSHDWEYEGTVFFVSD